MESFSISDIENLTGIKAHTLRIWEQRYDFVKPSRKEKGHRIYNNEDLKRMMRIAFLYHNGWKISRIATLTEPEIEVAVSQAPIGQSSYQSHIARLVEAMLNFDEREFTAMLDAISSAIGFEACMVHVCYPYLVKLGNLWTANRTIPAQEHFASYLIQSRVIVETDKLPLPAQNPEIVLYCPQGEFHELPLLFVHYLLRKEGWSTAYLGTNISLEELQTFVATTGASTIYLHLLTNFTGFEVDDYLEKVCTTFRMQTIVASGEAVQWNQRSFVNLKVLRSDAAIYGFIRRKVPA